MLQVSHTTVNRSLKWQRHAKPTKNAVLLAFSFVLSKFVSLEESKKGWFDIIVLWSQWNRNDLPSCDTACDHEQRYYANIEMDKIPLEFGRRKSFQLPKALNVPSITNCREILNANCSINQNNRNCLTASLPHLCLHNDNSSGGRALKFNAQMRFILLLVKRFAAVSVSKTLPCCCIYCAHLT